MTTPVERFWLLLKPDKKEVFHVYVYALFNGLVNLSIPLGIQTIINFIQVGQVSTSWILLVVIVVAGVSFTGFLQLKQLRIIENLQQKLFTRSAFDFTYRITKITSEAFQKYYPPELMNRFFDTLSIQKGLSKILVDFSIAVLQIFFGLLLLSFYHSFFILFSIIFIFLVFALFKLTYKRGLTTSLKESKYKYQVAYWLQELARVRNPFKLAGDTELPLRRTDKNVDDYLVHRESHFKILRQQFLLMIVLKSIVVGGLLIIGGGLVFNQQMNIGQFVAAEIIIFLIIASVEKLILSIENIYDVLTSLEKIGEVTDLELESTKGISFSSTFPTQIGIKVELANLYFQYPNTKNCLISNFSLTINSNDRVCFTGKNGSGKSTLLHIIAGIYKHQKGIICFNDLPIENFNINSLRNFIGNGFSNNRLFHGTFFENISLGRETVSLDDIKWATYHVGLSEFIKYLPQGLDTEIHSSDILPNSIVQKIVLARSIVGKPRLLLLDNVFEHIEDQEKNKIIDFVIDKANLWTLIINSSDRYLMSKCDQVISFT